jgi:adenylate kinase
MLNLILFGPPGAGKGTQSDKIIEKLQLVHLSTGDILRAEMAARTELGKQAQTLIDKGNLVPDEVVIEMVKTRISLHINAPGFIFDGFPRTVAQAEVLDKMLGDQQISISGLIALDVEHNELVKRLQGRGKESGRADDQDINIIENRIKVYNNSTLPVMDYYKKQNKLNLIDGMGTIDDIFARIMTAVEKIK